MQTKENKMGTMNVHPLLIQMALPIIISMIVQALYNIVDSIFVSRISEDALNAVSLSFPLQNLMIAISTGTGVGINAMLARSLGEKDPKRASLFAGNGIFLAACSYLVFLIFGLFFSKLYFTVQTDDAAIIAYGTEYLWICSVFSFGIFGQIVFERLLQATGKTVCTMITQGIGAIINLIFDPILIFGYFGFPEMGIRGAAVATILGQIVAMLIAIILNIKVNKEIQLKPETFRPHGETIGKIYAIGIPSIIMASVSSVMTFGMNQILLSFTKTATNVFGVYFKLQSFIFMPVFGLNNGMVPIIAYNYGARRPDRITKTIQISVFYATALMVIGFAVFQIFPAQLLGLFNASQDMLNIGIPALRLISISFLFAGFCIVCGSVFQALGKGLFAMITSVARQLLVLLPVAYLFSKLFGLGGVWWSYPVAEVVSLAASTAFLIYSYKTIIKPLYQENT